MQSVQIVLLSADAKMPLRGSADAAGSDLYACGEATIAPRSFALINTGIAVAIPRGYYGRVAERSGLACKGIGIGAGVIDADYRGEVKVLLRNFTDAPFVIERGMRCAQLIIEKCEIVQFECVESFIDTTDRGANGFGSSGFN
jgi:dUTP pyrophosphatase